MLYILLCIYRQLLVSDNLFIDKTLAFDKLKSSQEKNSVSYYNSNPLVW